ncbi:hypothetical protein AVEN_176104-1 [Araneus ventricosus]|uniref:Uncharacterized protein n=1 Tax=Araneus ventricosus TaxID=182803 RepID=A0A4Y2PN78_ARAVE|nr:hypothetical protein AVEN_176104-1 [Araneus ventricosus]
MLAIFSYLHHISTNICTFILPNTSWFLTATNQGNVSKFCKFTGHDMAPINFRLVESTRALELREFSNRRRVVHLHLPPTPPTLSLHRRGDPPRSW